MKKNTVKRALAICLSVVMIIGGSGVFLQKAEATPNVTAEVSTKGLEYNSAKALKYAKDTWNIDPYKVDCINYVRRCNAAGGVTTRSCTIPHYVEYLTKGDYTEYNKLKTYKGKSGSKTYYYVRECDNAGKIAPGDTLVYVCNKCGKLWHVGIVSAPDKTGTYAGYYRLYAHNGPTNNALIHKNPHKRSYCTAAAEETDLYVVHFKSTENGYKSDGKAYTVRVTDSGVNLREGPGTNYKSRAVAEKNKEYVIKAKKGEWGQLATNCLWIHLDYTVRSTGIQTAVSDFASKLVSTAQIKTQQLTTKTSTTVKAVAKATTPKVFTVKTTETVNMRKGAGTKYKTKGLAKKGKTYKIKAVKNGWGQLSSNGYWIYLGYTNIQSGYKVKISYSDLNQRTGPGKKYKSKGYAKKGTYTVKKISGGWCKLSNGYWVSMKYVKRV